MFGNSSTLVLAAADLVAHPDRPNGAVFAPKDTLMSLLATGLPLRVITQERCNLAFANGSKPGWIELRSKEMGSLRRKLAQYSLKRLQPKALFVEGPLSHRMIERYRDWTNPLRAIIVRSTPAQFDGTFTGRSQLPRILTEVAAYPFVICLSSRVAAKWQAFPELKPCAFRIIPDCGPEEECERLIQEDRQVLRQKFGLAADDFVLVCTASVQHRKGQDILIDAWAEIKKQVPRAKLLLAGPIVQAWGGKEILEKIEKHPMKASIQVLGPRQDALELTYASDVFVLPSREEALPRVILEAMLLKRAIVASDVDGIPDMIDHRENGYLFDFAKPQSLIDAIVQLAGDKALRERCGEKASQKYWTSFSRRRQTERYRDFLKERGVLA